MFGFSSVVVLADESEDPGNSGYIQKASIWHWLAGPSSIFHEYFGYSFGVVCPESEDGYHRASSFERIEESSEGDIYFHCICTQCGHDFTAYESDLKQSYEAQVSEMEDTYHTTTIDINGLSIAILKNNSTPMRRRNPYIKTFCGAQGSYF